MRGAQSGESVGESSDSILFPRAMSCTERSRERKTMNRLSALQVITVRYRDSHPSPCAELDAYTAAELYASTGAPFEVIEPVFPENLRASAETDNLGILGGLIADQVATARRADRAPLMVGGNCSHITGVIGGLQQAHGADARIGLVWFDAHGDFNTPGTTLSGMLGGMPVAVAAGLAFPRWREGSLQLAPLPTDRIAMVDVRNLDPPEEQLIRSTDIRIAAAAPGFPGEDLEEVVADLAGRCDLLYLHIDADVVDVSFVPNHRTPEPNGPDLDQVKAAIQTVMATGKVAAFAVVSVFPEGEGGETSVESGMEMIRSGLEGWGKYGMPKCEI